MAYKKQINILFWNARSISKRAEELPYLLKKLDSEIDVFIRVETCLTNDYQFKLSGFKILRKDRLYAEGGDVLIAVRNGLEAIELDCLANANGNMEICGVKITNIIPQLHIFACYRPPRKDLSQDEWHSIMDNIPTNSSSILVGDFNAHHQSWNCLADGSSGKKLFNASEKKRTAFA